MNDLSLKAVVELLGTFVFFSVILTTGEAIPIAIALCAIIYFGGQISGGHFNPAVTAMMLLKGDVDNTQAAVYVLAQVLGGVGALRFRQMTA